MSNRYKPREKVKFIDGTIVEIVRFSDIAWSVNGEDVEEYLVRFPDGKEKYCLDWELRQLHNKDKFKCVCGADSLTNRSIRDASHALYCPKYRGMK